MGKILAFLIIFLGFLAMVLAFSLIAAWPVQLLWNWLAPTIFGLKVLTFWQSWGLLMLCGLLFKSSGTTASKKSS